MATRVHHNRHSGSVSIPLLFGLVVALLALANVMALSNWHASMPDHDDRVTDSASLAHPHHSHHHHDDDDDGGAPVTAQGHDGKSQAVDLHALTHAMIHGFAGIVPSVMVAIPFHEATSDWYAGRSFVLSGISPGALLRPPRS